MITLKTEDHTVMLLADLGTLIPDTYKQVGAIVTLYRRAGLNDEAPMYVGTTTEAVLLHCSGKYVAVEQHRGVAFIQDILDEELLALIHEYEEQNDGEEEGTIFRINQTVDLTQEQLGEGVDADS